MAKGDRKRRPPVRQVRRVVKKPPKAPPAVAGERAYDAVLCDLDGVLRQWDTRPTAELERGYGVEEGTLARVAFAPELLQRAVTGALSDDEWRRDVAAALVPEHGVEVASDLVADWSVSPGRVDDEVLAVLGALRADGVTVALVTNATTRLEDDLTALGLTDAVDVVVSSARLGVAKPDPVYYFAAAKMADTDVARCLFVDNTEVNVDVARAVGMQGHLFVDVAGLRTVLAPRAGTATGSATGTDDA